MAKKPTFRKQAKTRGFTLVEILMVIAIISLLAAVAIPSYLRVRKRSQATRILQDLRIMDSALSQYALEHNKASGYALAFADLQPYMNAGSQLYTTGADLFGTTYGPFSVDSTPVVPNSTYQALSDVADQTFWSPYR